MSKPKTKTIDPRERIIVALDTPDIRLAKKLIQTLKGDIKTYKVGN